MSSQVAGSLPAGWKKARIDDLFHSWGGHTPSKSNPSYWGDGVPWVSSKDVKVARLTSSTFSVTRRAVNETGLKVCPTGTVLVVVRSGILAHTLPVAITEVPVTINQDLKAFYSDEPSMNEWLALFLRMSAQALLATSRRDGTTVQSIQYPMLKDTVLPVPPLEKRGRIIDAIDKAIAKQSVTLPHLETAKRAIERFRRAVLAAASAGRLTADWRAEHKAAEWVTERAADVCSKVQSGTTPKSWHVGDGGVPFLKVYNIVDQKLDFDHQPQFISLELHRGSMARATALPGDVLLNIVGPPLGKVAVVSDEYPEWSINQALTLFRPSDRITTEWLYVFLCSGVSVDGVLDATRGTVGQINISLSQCRDFQIPVPTLPEQAEICLRVSRLFDLAETVSKRVEAAGIQVERSSQAVLGMAFRGELPMTGTGSRDGTGSMVAR